MVARELQKRGCEVYYLYHAANLLHIADSEWTRLEEAVAKAATKQQGSNTNYVVLVVDEVHESPESALGLWHKLLRKSPGLIVIGAGIKKLSGSTSPKFHEKYPAFELLVTQGPFLCVFVCVDLFQVFVVNHLLTIWH
jgi:hypothetical protein